jgi:hypothetical protein
MADGLRFQREGALVEPELPALSHVEWGDSSALLSLLSEAAVRSAFPLPASVWARRISDLSYVHDIPIEVRVSEEPVEMELSEPVGAVRIPVASGGIMLTITALTHVDPIDLRAFGMCLATFLCHLPTADAAHHDTVAELLDRCATLEAEVERLRLLPAFLTAMTDSYVGAQSGSF